MTRRATRLSLAPIAAACPDAITVAQHIVAAGGEAYFVGGSVRDVLLGRVPGDVDIATNLVPERVAALFPFSVPTGIVHGTITVWMKPGGVGTGIEVTTYRSDGNYSDGRHPDGVHFEQDIRADLSRRDFTVNAMAADLRGELIDPYEGQNDLEARSLRAVGDPVARFAEDGLRTMRAVRFAAQLGFDIEPNTFAAIPGALKIVRKVAIERLRDELLKMLDASKPSVGLELMRTSGLMAVVLPELLEGVEMVQNSFHTYTVYEHTLACVDAGRDRTARLAALFHDIAKPRTAAAKAGHPGEHTFFRHDFVGAELTDQVLRRMRFSNEEREKIAHLVQNHMFYYDPSWSDGAVRRFVGRVGESNLANLFNLREADIVGRGRGEDPRDEIVPLQERIDVVLARGRALHVTDLAIDGKDVMATLGIPASRRVRDILEAMLEAVLEDPALNERERLLAWLKNLP